MRVRWFADFSKLEPIALLPRERGCIGLRVLLAEMFELVARKGYRRMPGQIQQWLWQVRSRTFSCHLLPGRAPFRFWDYEYLEIEIFLPEDPEALLMEADPYQIIRPEGAWDRPGVLMPPRNGHQDRTRQRELSYCLEKWCPGAESNHRHADFQSAALPLSYPGGPWGRALSNGALRACLCRFQSSADISPASPEWGPGRGESSSSSTGGPGMA